MVCLRSISINFRYKVKKVEYAGQEQNCPIMEMWKLRLDLQKLNINHSISPYIL
jgi:hypothetical protein